LSEREREYSWDGLVENEKVLDPGGVRTCTGLFFSSVLYFEPD
jgi:hypothetical protein